GDEEALSVRRGFRARALGVPGGLLRVALPPRGLELGPERLRLTPTLDGQGARAGRVLADPFQLLACPFERVAVGRLGVTEGLGEPGPVDAKPLDLTAGLPVLGTERLERALVPFELLGEPLVQVLDLPLALQERGPEAFVLTLEPIRHVLEAVLQGV